MLPLASSPSVSLVVPFLLTTPFKDEFLMIRGNAQSSPHHGKIAFCEGSRTVHMDYLAGLKHQKIKAETIFDDMKSLWAHHLDRVKFDPLMSIAVEWAWLYPVFVVDRLPDLLPAYFMDNQPLWVDLHHTGQDHQIDRGAMELLTSIIPSTKVKS